MPTCNGTCTWPCIKLMLLMQGGCRPEWKDYLCGEHRAEYDHVMAQHDLPREVGMTNLPREKAGDRSRPKARRSRDSWRPSLEPPHVQMASEDWRGMSWMPEPPAADPGAPPNAPPQPGYIFMDAGKECVNCEHCGKTTFIEGLIHPKESDMPYQ